jgi:hypothetical protein
VQNRQPTGTFGAVNARIALASVLLSLLAVTGCGDESSDSGGLESKSASQILADSAAALKEVKSYRVQVTQRSSKATADVELPTKLRLALREGPTSASIIAVAGQVYIKGNEAYWKDQQGEQAAGRLAGKWLKAPSTSADLKDVTNGLDPETLSRCLVKDHGTIAKGGTETVEGKQAVVLIDKGDRPGAAPGKLYVAAEGDPLPLRTIATGNQRPGGKQDPKCDGDTPTRAGDEAKFSRYNEPLDITAPPGAVDVGGSGTAS